MPINNDSVTVTPSAAAPAAGAGQFNALMLTSSSQIPIGTYQAFTGASAVADYFGPTSQEATAATQFFAGYLGNLSAPKRLYFSQYPVADVSAYLRGGRITLAEVQAASAGVLTITVDGVASTSASINLSGATSLSNAASIIEGVTWTPALDASVDYDPLSGAFKVTCISDGAASTISFATGTLSAALKLTAATGAVLSQGADAAQPAAYMTDLIGDLQDFVPWASIFEPDTDDKLAFAAWNSAQQTRYVYCVSDSSDAAKTANSTTCFAYLAKQASTQNCMPIYGTYLHAAALLAYFSGIAFNQTGSLLTAKFREFPGLAANVTSSTDAANLKANSYNFYGSFFASGNSVDLHLEEGTVLGEYVYADQLAAAVYLKIGLENALRTYIASNQVISFTAAGTAGAEAASSGVFEQAKTSGSVTSGVPLDATQQQLVLSQMGQGAVNALFSKGYVVRFTATPQDRAARRLPGKAFWTQGGRVHFIDLSSVAIL